MAQAPAKWTQLIPINLKTDGNDVVQTIATEDSLLNGSQNQPSVAENLSDHSCGYGIPQLFVQVTEAVHQVVSHDVNREIQPWENWVQWVAGQFYSPLLRTQNPRWIVSGGRGDCSESAAVLQAILIQLGIDSRFVGLGGHVVLEAECQDICHTLDPDYGIVFPCSTEQLSFQLSNPDSGWLHEFGVDEPSAVRYREIVCSREDNIALPWNAPISPRLKVFEDLCAALVWLTPVFAWICVLCAMRAP